jgi:hypothetical protein
MSKLYLIISLLLLLFTQCSKEYPESVALVGKWNFIRSEDTTYTKDGDITTYTHRIPGLTYQFTLSGYLFISPSWQDKMKYALRNANLLIITTPRRVYSDTLIVSTKDSLIFKDWRIDSYGDTVKSTIYLEK